MNQSKSQESQVKLRAAMYVDGFNLWHALDDLNKPHLKWLNLWRLGELIAWPRGHKLVKVLYCSAFYPGDNSKYIRHRAYKQALENVGVVTCMGHYVKEPFTCRKCERTWEKPTEKTTDISVALGLTLDAQDNVFDVAYLLTADTDQAITAKTLAARFSEKCLISVAPPNRRHSQHILQHGAKPASIDEAMLERAVFNRFVPGANASVRPREYDPPTGWVHPDQRPQNKK